MFLRRTIPHWKATGQDDEVQPFPIFLVGLGL